LRRSRPVIRARVARGAETTDQDGAIEGHGLVQRHQAALQRRAVQGARTALNKEGAPPWLAPISAH
jgi:hypothetical protein